VVFFESEHTQPSLPDVDGAPVDPGSSDDGYPDGAEEYPAARFETEQRAGEHFSAAAR
jgi:hypothetical protein